MNSYKNTRSRILCPALAIRVNVQVNRTIYYFIVSPEEVETDEFEFYLANFLRKIFHYSDHHYE